MSQKLELDYSRLDDVAPLLNNTPFASNSVERLSGGNTNYVYHLHLRAPYKHHHTLVLKHAKPYSAGDPTIPLPLERLGVEAKTLRRVKEILPTESLLVTVPTVYHFDDNAHIIVMEDCGLGSRTLKQLFMDETISTKLAGTICSALGQILASVHKHGSADKKLMHIVSQNVEMKRLSGWFTYGRLVDTVTGVPENGKIVVDPPPLLSEEEVKTITDIAKETSQAIISAKTAFTMGDFWPGNVVANTGRDESGALTIDRMFVVDWEVTKPGLQYLEVGQFAAELYLLELFNCSPPDTIREALRAFLSAYKAELPMDEESIRGAAVHLGVHLVCWTPRVPFWTPNERVREVVDEGVEYILHGRRGDTDWLKTSAVRDLLL